MKQEAAPTVWRIGHPGLGFLPWSNTVHYSSEAARLEALHDWLAAGMASPAYAADDGAALHFVGEELAQVVSSRPDARAYRIECRHGRVVTTPLATRYLGDGTVVPIVVPPREAAAGGQG